LKEAESMPKAPRRRRVEEFCFTYTRGSYAAFGPLVITSGY